MSWVVTAACVAPSSERLVAEVPGLPPGQHSMTAKIISMEGVPDAKPSNAHSKVYTHTHTNIWIYIYTTN
jgi:hypothetical protein